MELAALLLSAVAALASVTALLVGARVFQQAKALMATTEEIHQLTNSTMTRVKADLAEALRQLAVKRASVP